MHQPRVFFVLKEVEQEESLLKIDPILELPLLRLTASSVIVGLPTIGYRKLYLVPVTILEEDGDLEYGGGEATDLILVTWNLQFL
jgi:hypothetical protein